MALYRIDGIGPRSSWFSLEAERKLVGMYFFADKNRNSINSSSDIDSSLFFDQFEILFDRKEYEKYAELEGKSKTGFPTQTDGPSAIHHAMCRQRVD